MSDNSWQPDDDLIDATEGMTVEEYLEWLKAQCVDPQQQEA